MDAPREPRDRGEPRIRLRQGQGEPRRQDGVHLAPGIRGLHCPATRRRRRVHDCRDQEGKRPGRTRVHTPAGSEAPIPAHRRGPVGPQGGALGHRRGRIHRARALCPRPRPRRFRARSAARAAAVLARGRTGPFHQRRGDVRRQVSERSKPSDHPRPPRRSRAIRRGNARPLIRPLLALPDPDLVPRDGPVVPECERHQTEDDRRGPSGDVVPGLGGLREAARLDGEPPRLVPVPTAVLGHTPPDLAVCEVPSLDRDRVLRGTEKRPRLQRRHGPPPARD